MMMSSDAGKAQVSPDKPFISGGLINIKCYPNKYKELAEIKPSGFSKDDCGVSDFYNSKKIF